MKCLKTQFLSGSSYTEAFDSSCCTGQPRARTFPLSQNVVWDRKRQGSDGLKELFPNGGLGTPVREGEKKREEERSEGKGPGERTEEEEAGIRQKGKEGKGYPVTFPYGRLGPTAPSPGDLTLSPHPTPEGPENRIINPQPGATIYSIWSFSRPKELNLSPN